MDTFLDDIKDIEKEPVEEIATAEAEKAEEKEEAAGVEELMKEIEAEAAEPPEAEPKERVTSPSLGLQEMAAFLNCIETEDSKKDDMDVSSEGKDWVE
eukprot:g13448.t1